MEMNFNQRIKNLSNLQGIQYLRQKNLQEGPIADENLSVFVRGQIILLTRVIKDQTRNKAHQGHQRRLNDKEPLQVLLKKYENLSTVQDHSRKAINKLTFKVFLKSMTICSSICKIKKKKQIGLDQLKLIQRKSS